MQPLETDPLYQRDAYLTEFDAQVAAGHADGVILNRSAFFPGGGGQPPDEGTLTWEGGEATVTGLARQDGSVVHLLGEGPRPPEGAAVGGRLDWQRRYALMRTHTALHTLSGVIGRDYGALVTGGAMDLLTARMDFELPAMSADFAALVEAALQQEVRADRPVSVRFVTPEEFAAQPELVRTKTSLVPAGLDIVRVIDIEGLDRQADGGTHVRSTGEIRGVHVVGHESKGKGNKRLRIALDPLDPPAPE